MASAEPYDYSATAHLLVPFVNPFKDEPFIKECAETYGDLWQFKEEIVTWTFGVNRWRNYVTLRYRPQGHQLYMNWNNKEKICMIEDQRRQYVVLVMRAVDDNGKELDHCHSIVINANSTFGLFDLENLMALLEGCDMGTLNEDFQKAGYLP